MGKTITDQDILEVLERDRGATYYIANLIKKKHKDWDRSVTEIRLALKKLEKKGLVRTYKSVYQRQLSWEIIKEVTNKCEK